ncbi:uncharacterized protein EI90DRAFT_266109 [Cantharellus anzutake]|uniref:uncharacterized protein n=1 Tax=Cantharellus anzutake TaxID=1750568 RepID=UPI0019051935|nr:uncharacterized protein EI90DRAFT_266109 [Cantharellus anzutake]KAF8335850.1 hypothetical protein EI90DRAFT_266109 [Cantharellus anzutake]
MMGSPPPSSVPQEFTLRGWSRRRSEELCFWVPWTYPSHHSEMLNLLKLPHGDFEALLIGKDEVVLFRIGSMFDLWDPFPSSVCWFPGNWTLSSFLSELRGEGLPPAVFFGDPDGDEETFEEHFRGWYTLGRLFGAVDTFGYGYDEVFCEAHLLTGEEH